MKTTSATRPFIRTVQGFFSTWALMKAARMEPGNILTLVFFLLIFLFYRYVDDRILQSEFENKKSIFKA